MRVLTIGAAIWAAHTGIASGDQMHEFEEWNGWDDTRNRGYGYHDDDSFEMEMPNQSFRPPFFDDKLLDDWVMNAGTIGLKDRVALLPDAADRSGYFWAKKPLYASSLSATFLFQANGTSTAPNGFALWFHKDSPSFKPADENALPAIPQEGWLHTLEGAGFNYVGHKGNFEGFGLVLQTTVNGVYGPQISLVMNDGTEDLGIASKHPEGTCLKEDYRNSNGYALLRVQLKRNQITVRVKLGEDKKWYFVGRARLPAKLRQKAGADQPRIGWRIGFSAVTASTGENQDSVSVSALRVISHDASVVEDKENLGHADAEGEGSKAEDAKAPQSECDETVKGYRGMEYRGCQMQTRDGETCQMWSAAADAFADRMTEVHFPKAGLGDHNYCRNPDGFRETIWCYTATSWGFCDPVPASQQHKEEDAYDYFHKQMLHMIKDDFGDDAKNQTDRLKEITTMVERYLVNHQDQQHHLSNSISDLIGKVNKVTTVAGDLKTEVGLFLGGHSHAEMAGLMRNQIGGLKQHLQRDSQVHDIYLQKVGTAFDEAAGGGAHSTEALMQKNLASQREKLNEKIASHSSRLFFMVSVIFVLIALLGFALFRRIRNFEKKHFL